MNGIEVKSEKGNPEIKNRLTGAVIIPAGKYGSLKEAVKKEHYNLAWAYLPNADLSGIDLSGADLSGADIEKIPNLNTPTINEYIEKFNIEKEGEYIYVYKAVTKDLFSPNSNVKIKYDKGIKEVDFADCDVWQDCSYGISVSPTEEAAREFSRKIIRVKVHIGDIVCIPVYGHESKFRVKKCEVIDDHAGSD